MAITGTLEDREEVRTLHARYCLTIDTGRYDEWIDCFTEDGVFESPRFGKHSGRDGLRKFTARYKESLGGAQVEHVVANPAFELDGDSHAGRAEYDAERTAILSRLGIRVLRIANDDVIQEVDAVVEMILRECGAG